MEPSSSSPPQPPAEAPAGELQFDRADFGEASPGTQQCSIGGETITGTYYEINGAVVCEDCQARVVALRDSGGGFGRFARAAAFGVLAGAVGAGIYYGISALTGYNIGLVAILVGFMVGFAVSFGSRRRGGWFYQLLAVGITYCAIVATYVPQAAEALREMQDPAPLDAGASAAVLEEVPEPAVVLSEDEQAVVTWAVAVVVAFLTPVLMGFDGNIIGILIIAFGLWEAWRINRKQPFEVSGPYQVAGGEP